MGEPSATMGRENNHINVELPRSFPDDRAWLAYAHNGLAQDWKVEAFSFTKAH
jgi:hypothetical protein